MKKTMHTILFIFIGALAAFIISMILLMVSSIALIKLGEKTEATKKADCIIVPGARIGGRALDFRLDMTYKLYKRGLSDKIIVTGAQGDDEPMTEAKYMAAYLIDLGVEQKSIFLEEKSVSTYENFLYSKKIMEKKGFSDAIIVTNDYHVYRCGKMAELLDIEYQLQPVQKPKGIYFKGPFREMLAVMWYFFLGKF